MFHRKSTHPVMSACFSRKCWVFSDDLSKKIEDIPYKLFIQSDKQNLDFSSSKMEKVHIGIQVSEMKSGQNIKRSGPLYFKSDYPNIRFPEKVMLNADGFVRVPITVIAPRSKDKDFDGKIMKFF